MLYLFSCTLKFLQPPGSIAIPASLKNHDSGQITLFPPADKSKEILILRVNCGVEWKVLDMTNISGHFENATT